MNKPPRNFWQIWNMSFGFLGIQFGWGLQMANMSAIYEYLGAHADQIPILWLAAPLTGLIVQPIIGHASDRTWGRARPPAPVFPHRRDSQLARADLHAEQFDALWMAAGLLWILDASINISMEPFRAFVADMLPEAAAHARVRDAEPLHRPRRGRRVGAAVDAHERVPCGASAGETRRFRPPSRLSFYIGAAAFFGAVLWTIVTTKEYPPEDMDAFRSMKNEKTGSLPTRRKF